PAFFPLALHDALPFFLGVSRLLAAHALARCAGRSPHRPHSARFAAVLPRSDPHHAGAWPRGHTAGHLRPATRDSAFKLGNADLRSEEHTSELQSRENL